MFSTVCFQMFSGERWSGGCDGMQGEQPAQLQGEHGQRSMNSVHWARSKCSQMFMIKINGWTLTKISNIIIQTMAKDPWKISSMIIPTRLVGWRLGTRPSLPCTSGSSPTIPGIWAIVAIWYLQILTPLLVRNETFYNFKFDIDGKHSGSLWATRTARWEINNIITAIEHSSFVCKFGRII